MSVAVYGQPGASFADLEEKLSHFKARIAAVKERYHKYERLKYIEGTVLLVFLGLMAVSILIFLRDVLTGFSFASRDLVILSFVTPASSAAFFTLAWWHAKQVYGRKREAFRRELGDVLAEFYESVKAYEGQGASDASKQAKQKFIESVAEFEKNGMPFLYDELSSRNIFAMYAFSVLPSVVLIILYSLIKVAVGG